MNMKCQGLVLTQDTIYEKQAEDVSNYDAGNLILPNKYAEKGMSNGDKVDPEC